MFIVRNFLLFRTRALAQLDYHYDVSSKLWNSLKLMAAIRPGFLRAGQMAAWFFLCVKTSGMGQPVVPVSFLGGTTGTPKDSVSLHF
jgi:hypothetical protein